MAITPTEALTRCIEHREIFHDEMLSLMRMLMKRRDVAVARLGAAARAAREEGDDRRDRGGGAGHARVRDAGRGRGPHASRRPVRDRRRRRAHVQHLDGRDVRRGGRRRARREARQPRRVVELGQRGRPRSVGRERAADARAGRGVHRRDRHRLHVRAEPSQRDEERRAGPSRARRADDLQHPRSADESGRRGPSADGRVPSGPRRHPGPRAAAARRRSTRWSSTARTAWTRRRSAPRRWSAS